MDRTKLSKVGEKTALDQSPEAVERRELLKVIKLELLTRIVEIWANKGLKPVTRDNFRVQIGLDKSAVRIGEIISFGMVAKFFETEVEKMLIKFDQRYPGRQVVMEFWLFPYEHGGEKMRPDVLIKPITALPEKKTVINVVKNTVVAVKEAIKTLVEFSKPEVADTEIEKTDVKFNETIPEQKAADVMVNSDVIAEEQISGGVFGLKRFWERKPRKQGRKMKTEKEKVKEDADKDMNVQIQKLSPIENKVEVITGLEAWKKRTEMLEKQARDVAKTDESIVPVSLDIELEQTDSEVEKDETKQCEPEEAKEEEDLNTQPIVFVENPAIEKLREIIRSTKFDISALGPPEKGFLDDPISYHFRYWNLYPTSPVMKKMKIVMAANGIETPRELLMLLGNNNPSEQEWNNFIRQLNSKVELFRKMGDGSSADLRNWMRKTGLIEEKFRTK